MKWIVITSPVCFAGEALFLRDLAEAGVDAIHLRKPESDRVAFESLLEQLEPAVRRLMVTHDYFELAASYGLRGVHLNRRHPEPPAGWTGQLSCSCHSLEEVAQRKGSMDYVFLSPVSTASPSWATRLPLRTSNWTQPHGAGCLTTG